MIALLLKCIVRNKIKKSIQYNQRTLYEDYPDFTFVYIFIYI